MGDLPERKYRISGSGGAFPRAPKTLGLLAGRIAPWAAFGLLLLWSWRFIDLAHALPTYDDVLEVVWITSWYDAALRGPHGAQLFPLIFFPAGWHVATYAGGPARLLATHAAVLRSFTTATRWRTMAAVQAAKTPRPMVRCTPVC